MFGTLSSQLSFEVLSETTRAVTVWVIRVDEGVGDIPGVQGGSRGSAGSAQQRLD